MLVAIAASASVGRASTITLVSSGSATVTGSTVSGSETVANETGGYGPLSSLSYVLNTALETGNGSYSGPDGSLDFALAYDSLGVVTVGSSEAINGTITFTGGDGEFADATGSGTFDFNYLLPGAGGTTEPSSTLVSATATVPPTTEVPEPTMGALLLAGGVLASQRRRRSRTSV